MSPGKKRGHSQRKGRTSPQRLRLLDAFIEKHLFTKHLQESLTAVDLGFGETPITSIELLQLLQKKSISCRLLACDNDEIRVDAAQISSRTRGITYHHAGFELFKEQTPDLQLIRAMNVLRGYGQQEARQATASLYAHLAPGGYLLEGTSNADGTLLTAHIWQKPDPSTINHSTTRSIDIQHSSQAPKPAIYHGLILAMEENNAFAPLRWRDHLPRDLRRNARGNEPIYLLLRELQKSFLCELKQQLPQELSRTQALLKATKQLRIQTDKGTPEALSSSVICLWKPSHASNNPAL